VIALHMSAIVVRDDRARINPFPLVVGNRELYECWSISVFNRS
jgi:hypothetical protein